ncbi:MAG: hypothetical protein Q4C34_07075 [Bacteroidales bacterium]|nr:hypothetical protein [Bacteroidales bacterium]
MRHILSILICAISVLVASATTDFSPYKGVYASNTAEAVITDSVCIMFFQKDSTMQAIIEVPTINLHHQTVFAPNGNVSFPSEIEPFAIKEIDKGININGIDLVKVEDISTVEPYHMTPCSSEFDVGKCLQQWRLGVKCGVVDNMPACEINTNRHMFVYMVNPNMVYIRAAATRNNNNGTLFFQNIRMMKNLNRGEYTMHIKPDNLVFAKNDLEIDNSKFQPNACTYNPDGGIYWSLISFESDNILLNGCGETYQVPRPTKDTGFMEWIQFEPYSTVPEFPSLK